MCKFYLLHFDQAEQVQNETGLTAYGIGGHTRLFDKNESKSIDLYNVFSVQELTGRLVGRSVK